MQYEYIDFLENNDIVMECNSAQSYREMRMDYLIKIVIVAVLSLIWLYLFKYFGEAYHGVFILGTVLALCPVAHYRHNHEGEA